MGPQVFGSEIVTKMGRGKKSPDSGGYGNRLNGLETKSNDGPINGVNWNCRGITRAVNQFEYPGHQSRIARYDLVQIRGAASGVVDRGADPGSNFRQYGNIFHAGDKFSDPRPRHCTSCRRWIRRRHMINLVAFD